MTYQLIDKQLVEHCERRQRWVTDAFEFKAQITPYLKMLTTVLRHAPKATHIMLNGDKLRISIPVESMKDIEPWLESIQDIFGHEFGGSTDETTYGKYRTFYMKDFPLELVADIADNGEDAACRAVQVGEKIVPVYEIKCQDAE